MLKKILNITSILMLLASAIVVVVFSRIRHRSHAYEDIHITVKYNSDDTLITSFEIFELLNGRLISTGTTIGQVNLNALIMELEKNPYLDDIDITLGLDRIVRIQVRQRVPVVRVMAGDRWFFVDNEGVVMPVRSGVSARVAVATFENKQQPLLSQGTLIHPSHTSPGLWQIFQTAQHIHRNDQLRALIDMIFINETGELNLITKFGSHTVLLGDISNLEHKLENLLVFYSNATSMPGWNEYRLVNLNYKNMVVCSKI